jgi:hypothetical protein
MNVCPVWYWFYQNNPKKNVRKSNSLKKNVRKSTPTRAREEETSPLMNKRPKMEELHTLKRNDSGEPVRITERIGLMYTKLATYLLDDHHGVKLDTIKADAKDVEERNHIMFMRWLAGEGKAANWRTLVQALREQCQLNTLADDIVSALLTYKQVD